MKSRIELLQGVARLAGDGLLGGIGIVEDMHRAILDPVTRLVPFGDLVACATGFGYARVLDIAQVARRATDGSLALLGRSMPQGESDEPAHAQPAWLGALNGAVGDHLQASANPLAIDMRLCREGREIDPRSPALANAIAAAHGTLIVFVHGLGLSDLKWRDADGSSFGAQLESEHIACATQLRYNSGLRIPANGRELSCLLQQLHETHAGVLRRIVLVGHSMGGLVCRSACGHARRHHLDWSDTLDEVICLGSPHFGAPLERLGASLGALLAATSFTRSLAALADARSAGVKDLRDGWASDLDRTDDDGAERIETALPFGDRVKWCLAAATLSARSSGTSANWIGDGLVPVTSALGRHDEPARSLRVPAARRRVFTQLGHMELLTDPAVYAQIRDWIAAPKPR